MKKILNIFNVYEWIFVIVSFITMITLGIVYSSNALEIVSVLFGLLAASLNVKNQRYCFFFYAIYALIYGIMSYYNKQYGEAILNVFYNVPLYCFTIWSLFFSKRKTSGEKRINTLSKKQVIIIIVIIPVFTIIYGFILKFLDSNLPFINALATIFAVIASFLASRSYKQQWIFWFGYSFSLMYIWLDNYLETQTAGLIYLILNGIYLIINLQGLLLWLRLYREQNKEAAQ